MRLAYQNLGWLTLDSDLEPGAPAPVFGFSLGFDHAAQHEYGVPYLKREMGIPEKEIPIGVEDRTMTVVPQNLGFHEYVHRSSDRRSKKTMPAALLYCAERLSWDNTTPRTPESLANAFGVSFHFDFVKHKRVYAPERDDIVCAWSGREGFALHVRGELNVSRLRELHQALLDKKVSLADPAVMGFERKALSLVMNERLPAEIFNQVREADLAYLRLQQAATDFGVETALSAAGLKWHALRPRWESGEGSRLLIWLNPCDQKQFAYGWYSVDELLQWAQGVGPVVETKEIEALLGALKPNWGYYLLTAVNAEGLGLRRQGGFVWLDKTAGQAGAILDFVDDKAPAGLAPVRENVYALDAVKALVQKGQALYEARNQEKSAKRHPVQPAG